MTQKLISIVSPCFQEEDNVEACSAAVAKLFAVDGPLAGYDYEHIFVDNSSTDRTVEVLRAIAQRDPHVRVVVNARNYGPFRSTFNALRHAHGDAVVPMLPVDLQDPVELIVEFVRKWEEGYLRVYGVRTTRDEGFFVKSARRFYYRTVNKIANVPIEPGVAEFQLLDRVVIDALLRYRDYYPYIRGMISNVGFAAESHPIPYHWAARRSGISKNRLVNLVDQGLNGLISFSNLPMRLAILTGFSMAIIAMSYGLYQLGYYLVVRPDTPPGTGTLIVALFFLSGVQLAILGVLGEYIAAIHFQVRHGDIVVQRELINFETQRPRGSGRNAPAEAQKTN